MKQIILNKIQKVIENESLSEKELLYQLKGIVYQTELEDITSKESKGIAELVSESLDLINAETISKNTIKTGFTDLDNLLGGFGLGELIIIGGRPAMGKTLLFVNLSLNFPIEIPILYFSFDLSEYLLTSRFLSTSSGIEMNKIIQQKLTKEEKNQLGISAEYLAKRPIFINDSGNSSVTAFKAICKKNIEEKGVKVIIVDYLQLMTSNKHQYSRVLEISHITRALKKIARDYNVCVIASSQLSRAVESRTGDKKPQLSDLRESGTIEQDADKVIALYRPEYYGFEQDSFGNSTDGVIEIIVLKNRTGPLGNIQLLRDTNFTRFRDYDLVKQEFSFRTIRLGEMGELF